MKVHVICWDGVEYDRDTTPEEIEQNQKENYVKDNNENGLTFDFRDENNQ